MGEEDGYDSLIWKVTFYVEAFFFQIIISQNRYYHPPINTPVQSPPFYAFLKLLGSWYFAINLFYFFLKQGTFFIKLPQLKVRVYPNKFFANFIFFDVCEFYHHLKILLLSLTICWVSPNY